MTQGSPTKMLVLLPMLYFMGKINMEDPQILLFARTAFFSLQVIQLLIGLFIKQQIVKKQDHKKIFVPAAPKNPFDPDANQGPMVETTYFKHEYEKVTEFTRQVGIGAVMSSLIHFYFNVKQVVVIQSVMIPMNLFENVLVRAYVFGMRSERIWDEKFEGEEGTSGAITPEEAKKKGPQIKKQPKKNKKIDPSQAIVDTWDKSEEADIDALVNIVRKEPNVSSASDEWTALMVVCGSPLDSTNAIKSLVKAGADVCKTDKDGWTAIHWTAFHDRPEAAETLLSLCTPSEVQTLLSAKAEDGRSALDIAKEEKNDQVVAVFEKALKNEAKNESTPSKEGLRQRKPASSESTDINDVD